MLVLKREFLAGLAIALLLWAACGLGLVTMFDSRTAMAKMAPTNRGNAESPNVSLMFNVDWGEEYLPEILNILKDKKVPATFFPTGTWAEKNPELMGRMVAEGHEIGNHGGAHSHVETMPSESFRRLIESGEQSIEKSCGTKPSKLFAPPYGEWNDSTVTWAAESGYQTILWTVDTVDWKLPPPEAIWKRALAGAASGALVLLHPTEPTVAALPVLIDGIRAKGFNLVTVSDNLTGGPSD